MLSLFKETISSSKDNTYGEKIIQKDMSSVVKYWLKYMLLLSAIPFILSLFALTYIVPQLPRLAGEVIPNETFEVKDGKLTSTQKEPIVSKFEDFEVQISPEYQDNQLEKIKSGLLVTSENIFLKDPQGSSRKLPLSNFNGIKISRDSVKGWLETNTAKLYMGGIALFAIITLISTLINTLVRFTLLVVWSYLLSFALKKSGRFIEPKDILKISLYAAIPAIIAFTLAQILPSPISQFASTIDLVVFMYLSYFWINPLTSQKPAEVKTSSAKKKTSKKIKSRLN